MFCTLDAEDSFISILSIRIKTDLIHISRGGSGDAIFLPVLPLVHVFGRPATRRGDSVFIR